MRKQAEIWKFVLNCLLEQVPVMLLYVVDSKGSSPGRRGFLMGVKMNGQVEGSIGGGMMEHKFIELAKSRLLDGVAECSLHPQVHNKEANANQSGMICSGEQTNVLVPVTLNDKPAIEKIIDTITNQGNGYLQISPKGLLYREQLEEELDGLIVNALTDWKYIEKFETPKQLIIVGGGHCALALSRLMRTLNFHITLYEERQNLHTLIKNEFTDKKVIVDDYAVLEQEIAGGSNCFLIIMTVGYRTDDIAIRSLRKKTFRYFGVLGSKRKIEKMMADYRADGWDEKWLAFLSAPAGLQIESQTPEEIAISIAAEIIKINKQPCIPF